LQNDYLTLILVAETEATNLPCGHPNTPENVYVYPNGRYTRCRVCHRRRINKRNETRREENVAKTQRYQALHPEATKAQAARYRQENRATIRAKAAKHREENREQIRAYDREYRRLLTAKLPCGHMEKGNAYTDIGGRQRCRTCIRESMARNGHQTLQRQARQAARPKVRAPYRAPADVAQINRDAIERQTRRGTMRRTG
jgi:hypothetical protein